MPGREDHRPSEALDILDVWLKTPYEGGRHDISLGLIAEAEAALGKGRGWEGRDKEPAMQFEAAKKLIRHFKGDKYVYGFDVLRQTGPVAAGLGNRAVLVRDAFPGSDRFLKEIEASLDSAGVEVLEIVDEPCRTPRGKTFLASPLRLPVGRRA